MTIKAFLKYLGFAMVVAAAIAPFAASLYGVDFVSCVMLWFALFWPGLMVLRIGAGKPFYELFSAESPSEPDSDEETDEHPKH